MLRIISLSMYYNAEMDRNKANNTHTKIFSLLQKVSLSLMVLHIPGGNAKFADIQRQLVNYHID